MSLLVKTDDKIVELLHKKNKQGIADIYDKYGATLYGVILNIVKSDKMAEVLLQKVLIDVWTNIDHYTPSKQKLFSWLLHISRDISMNVLQNKKNIGMQTSQSLGNSVYGNNDSLSSSSHRELKKIIHQLDEKNRAVIDLIYLQGYNLKEVEQILQTNKESIQLRIRMATTELRKVLNT